MVIFPWDKNLEIGVQLIDEQHKQLLESVNAFFISYKCGNPHAHVRDCLAFLQRFALYHFQAEEAFQVECGFPQYRSHQAKHKYIQTQIKFHATKLEASGFSKESVDEFHDFIHQSIIKHMTHEDVEFARYYREHAANQAGE